MTLHWGNKKTYLVALVLTETFNSINLTKLGLQNVNVIKQYIELKIML